MALLQNWYYSAVTALGTKAKDNIERSGCSPARCGTCPGFHAGVGQVQPSGLGLNGFRGKRIKEFLLSCESNLSSVIITQGYDLSTTVSLLFNCTSRNPPPPHQLLS